MVICRYFLKGICKFGDYCKNEHNLDNYNYQQDAQQSGYSILRQATFNTASGSNAPNIFYSAPTQQQQKSLSDQDINTIIKVVVNDVNIAEKGGQWRLTCYGPFGDKPCLPGFEDLSFEEVRLSFYEAKDNAVALEQFRQQWQRMLSDVNFRFKSLLNPTPELLNILKQIYNHSGTNKTVSNTPNNIFSNANSSTSIFAQANQNLFGQSGGSIFGGSQNTQQTVQNTNIFSGGNAFSKPSTDNIFANANKSIFGNSNAFSTNNSIFANAFNQNTSFPQQQNQTICNTAFNVVKTNEEGGVKQEASRFGNVASQHSSSIFGNTGVPQNVFSKLGQTTGQEVIDESVYSKVEELTEDEIKWFQNENDLDLMKIPENPPPKHLCFT